MKNYCIAFGVALGLWLWVTLFICLGHYMEFWDLLATRLTLFAWTAILPGVFCIGFMAGNDLQSDVK